MKKRYRIQHFERNGKYLIHIKNDKDIVIASSDTSLNLPTIPQFYIEYFIEVANESGIPIDYIELEYICSKCEYDGFMECKDGCSGLFHQLKLQNNEVIPVISIDEEIQAMLNYNNTYNRNVEINRKKQSIEEVAEERFNNTFKEYCSRAFDESTIDFIKDIANIFMEAGAKYQMEIELQKNMNITFGDNEKKYSEDEVKNLGLEFLKIRHNDHNHKYYTENELWLNWFNNNKK